MKDSGKQKPDLLEYSGPDQIVSSYELEEQLKSKGKEIPSINGGIPLLDRYTEGFRGGELIVVSGPTGQGKTLLLQTFTEYFSKKENCPLFFSFEMPPRSFLRCFPSVPYFYLPLELKPYSWQWFAERCEENRLKHDGRIIIIDHLHFLFHYFQSNSPSLEIGRLVRLLKRLAVDDDYIVFLIAHITKIVEGQRARMGNIKDASGIIQEADTVLMIQRTKDSESPNQAVITVDKCRWTGVFGKTVQVQKIDGYLKEVSHAEEGGRTAEA